MPFTLLIRGYLAALALADEARLSLQVLGVFLSPFLRWVTNAFWDLIQILTLSQTTLLSELAPSSSVKNSSWKALIWGKVCLVSPWPIFWPSTTETSVFQLEQYS